jgi:glycosyltransferase involved in cell wall biosynthesis
MKIVLIGPVYPYKGGISHYTTLMYRALKVHHEVTMISFKLQYPKLLFKKEQKDYRYESFRIKDTQYLINTANPFNWLNVVRSINRLQADIIIFQWWHPYFAPCYYILTKLIKRSKILFVCHNVFPHERFLMDRWLCKMIMKQGNYFVTQSHMDEKDLLEIKPDARYIVTPHPTYNAFKMQNLSKETARQQLEMENDTRMILFFGFVREYKGLKYLLKAMPLIRTKLPDLQLWVVGDFGGDREDYIRIIEEEGIKDNIRLVEGYIPDSEVEKYFAATDLVVLPYVSATQSGIAQIAYGFEKPVVVTNVGGLPDIVKNGETGYIVESENETAIAEAVIKFFHNENKIDWKENIKAAADEFSWETMVSRIEKLLL